MRGVSAMAKRQKRVFILGGGAALGAHHAGALKLLEEQDIVPDAIIGSSIGVINACCYGSGGVAGLETAWKEFSSLPRIFSPSLRHNPLLGVSLFSMDRLSSGVEQYIDFQKLYRSPLELEFVLLNLSRGRGEMHGKRECADWRELRTIARAGYAIPLLFPPIQFRGDWYVDGGFAWNIPLDRAIDLGATEIYLLAPIASQLPYRSRFRTFAGFAQRFIDVMRRRRQRRPRRAHPTPARPSRCTAARRTPTRKRPAVWSAEQRRALSLTRARQTIIEGPRRFLPEVSCRGPSHRNPNAQPRPQIPAW